MLACLCLSDSSEESACDSTLDRRRARLRHMDRLRLISNPFRRIGKWKPAIMSAKTTKELNNLEIKSLRRSATTEL